jgi:hypothetical protein
MITVAETLPGAESAAAAEPTSETSAAAPSISTSAANDTVAAGEAAFAAPAYAPSGSVPRRSSAAPGPQAKPESGTAAAARFGPHYALIRAALPSALHKQLDAQATAGAGGLAGGDSATDESRPAFCESDLARLVRGSISGTGDTVVGVLVARLARDIARYGAAFVARRLRLANDRIAFAAPAGMPSVFVGNRVQTRAGTHGERRRPDRPDEPDDRDLPPASSDGDAAFSVTDTVYFGGVPVAAHRTVLPQL